MTDPPHRRTDAPHRETDPPHVEFIGPPGAGKSAIHRRLIENPRYYGELYEDAVERLLVAESGRRYRLAYRLLPSLVTSPLETLFVQTPVQRRMFAAFVAERPAFSNALYRARQAATHDPDQVVSLLQYAAERYQLGVSTVRPDETLCLDEGFMMGAVSVLWRSEGDQTRFSIDEYLEDVPTPKTLVHVTAPTEVCLRRQRERDELVSETHDMGAVEAAQRRHEDACSRVLDAAAERESITTVTVANTAALEDVVGEVERVLE
ncbi:AAA domain-containing protein [Natronorubrum sediminis]|uniref:AAA domain-containing protein n=1 Tax=Natronorubrum sediminis TaxID=640943 RepID=A0A1H6G730_9EURY|nr:AAA family ATPase [Natronorubrum sediminis]SEH17794.1 AAA domain-containing protein [Natronorubrum sediminis]